MLNLEYNVGIYMVTNVVTGDCYIGQSTNIPRRIYEHFRFNHPPITPLKEAIRQYGKENFSVTLLEQCRTKEELFERERYWIAKIMPAYNRQHGGHYKGGSMFSDEVRAHLSEAAKRQWQNMSEDQKQSALKNLTGPGKGHPVSSATREKLRHANLGRKHWTPEMIEKRNATVAAKKASGWHKAKPKEPMRRAPIICNETGKHYRNIKEAASDMGMCRDIIFRQLNGQTAKAKGYTFSREV